MWACGGGVARVGTSFTFCCNQKLLTPTHNHGDRYVFKQCFISKKYCLIHLISKYLVYFANLGRKRSEYGSYARKVMNHYFTLTFVSTEVI